MHFSALPLTLLAASLPLTNAAYGSSDASTTSAEAATSTSTSNKIVINVGQTALTFSPSEITASVGQILEFHFFPNTHSVAQSNFSSPCNPLPEGKSFFSGGITTNKDATSGLTNGWNSTSTYQIVVNDTAPIWFYCGFPGHCGGGMVGSVNAATTGNKTFSAYKALASQKTTVTPARVQGGVIAAALVESSENASSTTSTGAASTSSKASAGIEGRGSVRWTLLGLTGVVAVGVGSLMA